jgi:hypothetical protein
MGSVSNSFLYTFQAVMSPTPTIVRDANGYQVWLDGQPLFRSPLPKFSGALQGWFEAFWCFALEYPPKLTKTCLFIESIVLGHKKKIIF